MCSALELKLNEYTTCKIEYITKDHTAKAFQPCYEGNYRIVSFKGNQVEVRKTEGGNTTWVHLTDVKYILPVDNVINKLPDY